MKKFLLVLGKAAMWIVVTTAGVVFVAVTAVYIFGKIFGTSVPPEHVRNPPVENRLQ